jgi:glycosyltransferase involved in cell wall biosynthesis
MDDSPMAPKLKNAKPVLVALQSPAKRVSVIVPVFNEQDCIKLFVERITQVFLTLDPVTDHEILFVNDGSSDSTEFIIRGLMTTNPHLRLVNLSRNFGKDAALSAGLDHAIGDAAIPMDVDLQDPPELIPQMISLWQAGARIVNARRVDRAQDGYAKRLSANAFYHIFNQMADRPIPHNVGDFRLLDRQVVDVVRTLGERARFNKALFNWVGFETAEITFERPKRAAGKTSWNYWKLWNFALDGIFAASTTPLRIWSYIGMTLASASFVYAAFIFVRAIFTGIDTPGYASTVILILLFGGLNLLAIGIIGEYVGRIYTEVRNRPLYVVRSILDGSEDT